LAPATQAKVSATGQTGVIDGLKEGSAQVTVIETESNKSLVLAVAMAEAVGPAGSTKCTNLDAYFSVKDPDGNLVYWGFRTFESDR
jgi:hypothetical protein